MKKRIRQVKSVLLLLRKQIIKKAKILAIFVLAIIAGQMMSGVLSAQVVAPPTSLASLKTVAIPEPPNLNDFVQDRNAAIALGKALFWDMQVGSDGMIACASCHFHAGADNRSKNQLSPGLLRVNNDGTPNPDTAINLGGLNYQLTVNDFPFHKLADPNNRNSQVISDTNDVSSSQGAFKSLFSDITPRKVNDVGTSEQDPIFNINGTNIRRVEPRNTPTVINAVFNFRNFWDGRAQDDFNGVNPFGSRDPDAKVVKAVTPDVLQEERISLKNASLASQAVGPPLSDFEMSFRNRYFRDLGKKLITLRPLARQQVHSQDSVLASSTRWPLPGLKPTYAAMIKTAFKPEWWNANLIVQIDANGKPSFISLPSRSLYANEYRLMEYNFALFFGLAVQMYQATLISDNTPFDQYLEGNTNALTAQQKLGKELFEGKAKCINCHGGAELTNASVRNVRNERLERMVMGNGAVAVYDNGFYNIGVRPTNEDLGLGGKDPFGNPLSESRLAQQGKFYDPNLNPPITSNERVAVDGAFKTPSLRNIELTAPYMHNGGLLTLRQMIDFYNRGGDFHEQNIDNLDPDIQNLGLNETEKEALVAFMKALTDERVRYDKAPFDHPQLFITNGQVGNQNTVFDDGTGKAKDEIINIPAVGRNGGSGTPNFSPIVVSTTTTSSSSGSLEGSVTQQDCPSGTTLKFVSGGYACLSN